MARRAGEQSAAGICGGADGGGGGTHSNVWTYLAFYGSHMVINISHVALDNYLFRHFYAHMIINILHVVDCDKSRQLRTDQSYFSR